MSDEAETTGRGPARVAPRVSLFLLTNLATPDGVPLGKARVRNLSASGLMADCERPISAGMKLLFELRGVGKVSGTVVWSRDDKIGVAFDNAIDPALARKPVSSGESRSLPTYLRQINAPRR